MSNSKNTNPFEILGIGDSASDEEIKQAFMTQKRKYQSLLQNGSSDKQKAAADAITGLTQAYKAAQKIRENSAGRPLNGMAKDSTVDTLRTEKSFKNNDKIRNDGSKLGNASVSKRQENGTVESLRSREKPAPRVMDVRENHNYQMGIIALLVVIIILLVFIVLRPTMFGSKDAINSPQVSSPPRIVEKRTGITEEQTSGLDKIKTPISTETAAYVIGTDVNIRTAPSMNARVVGSYELGEKVTVLETKGEWAKVRRGNGQVCYVSRKFIGSEEDLKKRKNLGKF